MVWYNINDCAYNDMVSMWARGLPWPTYLYRSTTPLLTKWRRTGSPIYLRIRRLF